jgi:hypothetical protein
MRGTKRDSDCAVLAYERFNIGRRGLRIDDPANLHGCAILIVTGDHDPRHPRDVDGTAARYLGAEFGWLEANGK